MKRHPIIRWFQRHRWTLESTAVVAAILAAEYGAGAILGRAMNP